MDRDLVQDLWQSNWFLDKIRTRDDYAQNVYAALCNMRWQPSDVFPILRDEWWSCSWRTAGGIVADFLGKGDYMDWYCSGIGFDDNLEDGRVPEGTVTDEIRADFARLGWHPSEWPKDNE